jgi:hypothetical protein
MFWSQIFVSSFETNSPKRLSMVIRTINNGRRECCSFRPVCEWNIYLKKSNFLFSKLNEVFVIIIIKYMCAYRFIIELPFIFPKQEKNHTSLKTLSFYVAKNEKEMWESTYTGTQKRGTMSWLWDIQFCIKYREKLKKCSASDGTRIHDHLYIWLYGWEWALPFYTANQIL